jgi:hypothetical protein
MRWHFGGGGHFWLEARGRELFRPTYVSRQAHVYTIENVMHNFLVVYNHSNHFVIKTGYNTAMKYYSMYCAKSKICAIFRRYKLQLVCTE